MEPVIYYEILNTALNAFIILIVSGCMIKATFTSAIRTWFDYAVAVFFFIVFCIMGWLIGDIAITHILFH